MVPDPGIAAGKELFCFFFFFRGVWYFRWTSGQVILVNTSMIFSQLAHTRSNNSGCNQVC